jgi:hypothetical protein
MTNTLEPTIDKQKKKIGEGKEPDCKAWGEDLVTSTTIERPLKNVDTISLADP